MKLTSLLVSALIFAPSLSSAQSHVVVDAGTGTVISATGAADARYPASLTKIMTAHLALTAIASGRLRPDTPVIMSPQAASRPPSRLGLPPGGRLTLSDALEAMLVRSYNDVASAVAETVSGDERSFVIAMNAEASRLGMRSTRFVNPHGLHHPSQVTSAVDMALLATEVMRRHAADIRIFGLPSVKVGGKTAKSTNKLLGVLPGTFGMKTGYTCASGFNIVTTVSRGGRILVGIFLGHTRARERDLFATRAIEAAFHSPSTAVAVPVGNSDPADLSEKTCNRKAADRPAVSTTNVKNRETTSAIHKPTRF